MNARELGPHGRVGACCENCGTQATVTLWGGATEERDYCDVCGKVAEVAGMLEMEGFDPTPCYSLLALIAAESGLGVIEGRENV